MADNSREIEKRLKLINADGVGPVTFKKIIDRFSSADKRSVHLSRSFRKSMA